MAANIEKSKEQTKSFVVEDAPIEPTVVSIVKDEPEKDDELDEIEDIEQDDDSEVDDELDEIVDDGNEPEVEQAKPAKQEPVKSQSKEQRKIQALKNEANRQNAKIADLERKLAEKKEADNRAELVSKYVSKGLDESDAIDRADKEIKQSSMEKQLELLMFEKQNRRVLTQYPDADNDLERIMVASKVSGMTVEQVCRGLYGTEVPEREKRAIAALKDSGEAKETHGAVANSIRTASVPKKSVLTPEQLRIKRYLETLNKGKPLSDEDVLKYIPT